MRVITEALRQTEVLYASYVNDTTHKPFAVVLDHEKQLLVVAIRGTLSLEDCITDALCDPASVSW
jgi:sn1-specific diacylglycerol lipase